MFKKRKLGQNILSIELPPFIPTPKLGLCAKSDPSDHLKLKSHWGELPNMMSALGGGNGKANVVREAEVDLYY